jgi:Zn-dependent M28 family amino/carboxypeptidase
VDSLRDTYVLVGAHYDHIGYEQFAFGDRRNAIASCTGQTRPTPRPGDIINNGADDDGSGTVTLMALAKAFSRGPRMKRSLLLVWHTSEEGGLTGSRFMADHPIVPLEKVSAQLNIDMVGRNRCDEASEANTVYVVGADRISTELHNVNEDANAALPSPLTLNYDLNDPSDLESIYTRSDHYSYASKGVPDHLLHHRPASRLSLRHRRSGQDRVSEDGEDCRAGLRDSSPCRESRSPAGPRQPRPTRRERSEWTDRGVYAYIGRPLVSASQPRTTR